ncbi:MAG: ThuA domain-containing protein [Chthoniobacteraceae bacterium]
MKLRLLPALLVLTLAAASAPVLRAAEPLKVLLITGGCCHDYAKQKDILKEGLEARANVVVTQVHTDDKSTKPPLPIYGNPDYAKGYDLVIHDECSAGIAELATIDGVIKPHLDGIPGVNLHCAMHCYRFGDIQKPLGTGAENGHWYEYLGLHSTGHGPQEPIALSFVDKESPITKGMTDWTTIKEELYNNIEILGGKALTKGKQMQPVKTKGPDGKDVVSGTKEVETVVAWTNEFGPKKTKVFSTTIGHNNETVADARYLDLVTRGVLWASGHINADGTPAKGFGPGGK